MSALARGDLWAGTYTYLPTLPIFIIQQPAIVLFANQNIGGREAQRRVEERVVGRPSSLLPGLLLWCDAVQWNPDTKRKQRIPFDVSHNFVLPTKMNI